MAVLINSWYFHFDVMVAVRAIDHNDQRSLMSTGGNSILKRVNVFHPWTNFFSEPECKFNHNIDKAYREYLLSEEIEKMLSR